MKKFGFIYVLIFASLVMAACASSPSTNSSTSLPTTQQPTIPENSPTPIPPTATAVPTPTLQPEITGSFEGSVPKGAVARLGKGQIGAFAVSPDGTSFAVGYAVGIDFFASDTFKLSKTVPTTAHVWSISYSNDGKLLAAGLQDGTSLLISVDTGKIIKKITAEEGQTAFTVFSPDGKNLIINSGKTGGNINFWHPKTGNKLKSFSTSENEINSLTVSPDSKMLITRETKDDVKSMKLWDIQKGSNSSGFPDEANITKQVFSPDSQKIAILYGDKGTVRLWDIAESKEIGNIDDLGEGYYSLAFSQDGEKLAVGGKDTKIINVKSFDVNETLNVDGSTDINFINDGKAILVVNGESVALFDTAQKRTTKLITGYMYGMNSVVYSSDGKYLATTARNGNVTLWNVDKLAIEKTLVGHSKASLDAEFVQNDTKLISAGLDGKVIVWDVAKGEMLNSFDISDTIKTMKVSQDGKFVGILAGKKIQLWDWEKGELAYTIDVSDIKSNYIGDFSFIPGAEEVLVGPIGQSLFGKQGAAKYTYEGTRESDITLATDTGLAYGVSEDGKYIVSSGWNDDFEVMVNIHPTDPAEKDKTFKITGFALDLVFSKNMKYLGCGGSDSNVYNYDFTSKRLANTFTGHVEGITGVAYSPDESTMASSSWDGSVILWKIR